MAKYDSDYLLKEEKRNEVWEGMHKIVEKRRRHSFIKNRTVLCALPYIIFNFLFTAYLTYLVPFYQIKKVSSYPFAVNIKFLRPVARLFKNIFAHIPVEEPWLSIIGLIVFGFVVPLIIAVIIKIVISNKSKEIVVETEKLEGDTKEQCRKIISKYSNDIDINYKEPFDFFTLLLIFGAVMGIVVLCVGRLNIASPAYVGTAFIVYFVLEFILVLLYRALIKNKILYLGSEISDCNDAAKGAQKLIDEIEFEEEEERKEREARERQRKHNEEVLSKLNNAYAMFRSGDYKRAHNHFDELIDMSDNEEVLKDSIIEIQFCYHASNFMLNGDDYSDIAEFAGVIKLYKGYPKENEKIENDAIREFCEKFATDYEAKILPKIKEDYQKGMKLFEEKEYIRALAYFSVPQFMFYEDSLAAYYISKYLGENIVSDFMKISKNLQKALDYGIKSGEIRQMADSYSRQMNGYLNEKRGKEKAKKEREREKERELRRQQAEREAYDFDARVKQRMRCIYYNAGICNKRSSSFSVAHCFYNQDGGHPACSEYKGNF